MKNFEKSLICFSICVFILTVCQGGGVQQEEPETITIKIFIDNGEVKCEPDPAEARYGDTVIWISQYVFAVDFGKKTPFKEFKFKAKKDEVKKGKGAKVITKEAEEKNKKIRFKYFVAVSIDGEIFTADPDLDIKP